MTDKDILKLYYQDIDETNNRIEAGLSWTKYAKRFKEVNLTLYKLLCTIKLTSIKNEYLRNWVKNLREE
jgi:hypothetical protein